MTVKTIAPAFTIRVVRSNFPIACSVSNRTSFAVLSSSNGLNRLTKHTSMRNVCISRGI